jgi:hypothetical protein
MNMKIPAPAVLEERLQAVVDAILKQGAQELQPAFEAALKDSVYPSYVIDTVNKRLEAESSQFRLVLGDATASAEAPKTKTADVTLVYGEIEQNPVETFSITWTEI